jgi:hypothetical protein
MRALMFSELFRAERGLFSIDDRGLASQGGKGGRANSK